MSATHDIQCSIEEQRILSLHEQHETEPNAALILLTLLTHGTWDLMELDLALL